MKLIEQSITFYAFIYYQGSNERNENISGIEPNQAIIELIYPLPKITMDTLYIIFY